MIPLKNLLYGRVLISKHEQIYILGKCFRENTKKYLSKKSIIGIDDQVLPIRPESCTSELKLRVNCRPKVWGNSANSSKEISPDFFPSILF